LRAVVLLFVVNVYVLKSSPTSKALTSASIITPWLH
jgi:hypothetical protein